MNDNNLAHIGVLGMKWGRRKSPSSSGSSAKTSQKKTLSEAEIKQQRIVLAKKVAIVGGAAVATGLAVYGTYKISKFVKGHSEEIKAAKNLVGLMMSSTGKSSKGAARQVPLKPMSNAPKKYTDAEWTRKKAEMLREIKADRPPITIKPEVRAKIRKELMETNPVYRDLIKEQVENELKYGAPTPAQMQRAKETIMRELNIKDWS